MVKSGDGGGGGSSTTAIAPFLKKCYDMVDEEATNSIISWSPNDDSFIIWDMTEFSVKLLPVYFKHSNSSSFVRQLNIYGFRKVDPDRWEFANDEFIRGQKHLLKNITRRKNPQGSSNRKVAAVQAPEKPAVEEPCEEVEKVDLCKEIENLKIDRNAVTQELVQLRKHQESADKKLLVVRDRLKGMETNQQQMLSFLVLVMQHPGFVVQLLNPKENGWRMAEPGSIVEQGTDENEPLVSDGRIVRYQPTPDNVGTRVHHGASNDEGRQDESPRDWMKDFSISSDFMKLLSEETFATENNHKPFTMPEIRDDTTWEQLLLGTCPLVNNHDTKEDGEDADDDFEFDIERTLPSTLMEADVLEEEMEEFMRREGAHLEEQMCPVASESSLKEGNATYMM